MAQLLEKFEDDLEPLLPQEAAEAFKALVRRKLNGFATDVIEGLELDGMALNGAAQGLRDRIQPDGRQ